eukprot:scaffold12160_cov75-Skeletonema_marinoi.AAC.2
MSADKVDDMKMCCASCGIAEVDELKLKECTSCDLVRYCSNECQKNHKSRHKEVCKRRAAYLLLRAAVLRDKLLFKQPECTHLGDCPICMIPLSLDLDKAIMHSCCSKTICKGCAYANEIREVEASLCPFCPFCRQPVPQEGSNKNRMKRIEANDPIAITHEGIKQDEKGEYSSAFEYYTKAAQLGDAEAHYQLSILYHHGHGIEKDMGKEIYHSEEAAIGGHPSARYNIGVNEGNNGNIERAVKHWIISANLGHDGSIKSLMTTYREGFVSKEDLASALRAHKTAVDANKSTQRNLAEEFYLG